MIGAFSFLNLKIAEIVKRLDKFGQLWLVGLITISGSFKNTSKQKIKLPDIVVCPVSKSYQFFLTISAIFKSKKLNAPIMHSADL